jgi:hypothetical protein
VESRLNFKVKRAALDEGRDKRTDRYAKMKKKQETKLYLQMTINLQLMPITNYRLLGAWFQMSELDHL